MKTVVYLDILLLTNFLAGWCLLQASAKLSGAQILWWRAILASVVAACSTLILLAPALPTVFNFFYKLLTAFIVVFLAFGYRGWRPFLRCSCWFFILNLGLAGMVILAIFRGSAQGLRVNNLSVYMNLSPLVLVLCILATYFIIRLVLLLFGKPQAGTVWRLSLSFGAETLRMQGYHDTGFLLKDPVSGKQAVLVSWPAVHAQLPAEINQVLQQYFCPAEGASLPEHPGLRILPCAGIGGRSTLPAFAATTADLSGNGRHYAAEKLLVAFIPDALGDGQFDALFGNELLLNETKRRKSECAQN